MASSRPTFHLLSSVVGLVEALLLTLLCVISVAFLQVTLLQVCLPVSVGGIFSILYLVALVKQTR
jgi:uncharacterized protein YacL